ncbi:MAG: ABC transporter ATP-binding protein [Deferribacteraceae bacterium]|nr:ABC transporter ATP-binding protein [Deferribacteraceae bacterium]
MTGEQDRFAKGVLLEARGIKKSYKRGDNPFCAADNISLSINPGEFIGITGRSGSGKSTLMNILAGLMTPDEGEVFFEGKSYKKMTDRELSALRCNGLGYIMQGLSVLPNFTVYENILIPEWLDRRRKSSPKDILKAMKKVGIAHLKRQYPSRLSGGELRRVSIARALLSSPKLLIADEPTSDLDEETAENIVNILSDIAREGVAVLMVTHDREAAAKCGREYQMKNGVLT